MIIKWNKQTLKVGNINRRKFKNTEKLKFINSRIKLIINKF